MTNLNHDYPFGGRYPLPATRSLSVVGSPRKQSYLCTITKTYIPNPPKNRILLLLDALLNFSSSFSLVERKLIKFTGGWWLMYLQT